MFKNLKTIKLFILLFCFSVFSSISQTNDDFPLNNIAINEIPKPISSLIFEDFLGNKININDYQGKLVLINFWATWCAPCKKEMPSLDKLSQDKKFKNLEVLAINMEQPNKLKTKKFFDDLNINNLKIYFDPKLNFVKEFKLRGVPTTVLVNKKGEEFARIIGEVDFEEKKFLKWLLNYD
jgi:thiol-disulfide isomerase/thioredoxin